MLERVDPRHPDAAIIARAADVLRRGGLVAFPTETVYGLGANALDSAAVDRIFTAKGRPAYNPVIVHVADAGRALDVAREWPDVADRLARAFWPGPLTLVLPKRPEVPSSVTAGLDTVAVRVPSHPVALALLEAAGLPIAAPSANRSTEVSPTTGSHVEKSLGDAVDLILEAGPTPVGIESTVVDVTVNPPALLRPGSIMLADLARVAGDVSEAPPSGTDRARRSPGMLDRHYAPRAKLVLASSDRIRELVEGAQHAGRRVGAIAISATFSPSRRDEILTLPNDPDRYAARLYATLHALDDAAVELIVVENPPDVPAWRAVRDRLERAAHT
jgi:L-threonylcarbamoyladenylate synthase